MPNSNDAPDVLPDAGETGGTSVPDPGDKDGKAGQNPLK